MRTCAVILALTFVPQLVAAGDKAANTWTPLEKAAIVGRRWDVPLGYAPEQKRFIVLGGRTTFADYRKPRSYDVLTLDPGSMQWENSFPTGKDWGPRLGACEAPHWKNEYFLFRDVEGNVRPNWTVYGTFSLGQLYDYDPDTRRFFFYAGGKTFSYDPAQRVWADLATPTEPAKELGGILLWSSMVYDRHNKRFVLFGGGNIQSPRGDPGTWTYTPATNAWAQLKLDREPPQRANSRLAYDPVNKRIVLFGGDQLNQLVADTWTFDVVTQKWEERKPERSPSPRGGHALLWLAKSKKILMLGGYGYTSATGYVEGLYQTLPLEAWTYDVAANRWDLVHRLDAKKGPQGPGNFFLSAAADEDDRVVVLANGTWMCSFDAGQASADAAKFGVKPGTVARRSGPHDPAWYKEGVPEADPAKVVAELKDLPANRWVVRPTPKLPRPNMDWGSAVFAPELDLIMRFSGGHSAYSGTAPQVYDVKTDRYTIPFTPEYPLEYVYSNDQVSGEWSFKNNPWMTGHTYKSTGYDRNLKCLVFAPHNYTYFFDPKTGAWSRSEQVNPYRASFYIVTVCSTPQGAVVWADPRDKNVTSLWRLDAQTRAWKPLPLTGSLPGKSPDHHCMTYDSKRDRLLFFSDLGPEKGDMAAYDMKTGQAKWLNAAGKEQAAVPSRETIYLPEHDMVLIAAHVPGPNGEMLWPVYDCAKNAWFGAQLTGADPVGKGRFNNSLGLMHDPNRGLIWAVGQNSHVHVMRFEPKTAAMKGLGK